MFDFIMREVLGMQWISQLLWKLLIDLFSAETSAPLWGSIHFFIYDTIKITIFAHSIILSTICIASEFFPFLNYHNRFTHSLLLSL